jgi:hypothetical protein
MRPTHKVRRRGPLDGLAGGARAENDAGPDLDGALADAPNDAAGDAHDAGDALDDGPDPFVPTDGCVDRWCFLNPKPLGWSLRAVWSDRPDRLFAVGERGTIARWDARLATVPISIPSDLNDVDGPSASDLWIVGEAPSTILRLERGRLTSMTPPTKSDLTRVVARDGEVWIQRRDGAPYRSLDGALVPTPDAVSGRGWSGQGLAIVPGGGIAVGTLGFAARWDGRQWVNGEAPYLLAPSVAAYATKLDEYWSCVAYPSPSGLVRGDGRTWSPLDAPWPCRGIGGRGAEFWIVGQGIAQWNGVALVARDTPLRDADLFGVAMPSSEQVFAVGHDGLALRWDGRAWTRLIEGALVEMRPTAGLGGGVTIHAGVDEVFVTGPAGVLWSERGNFAALASPPGPLRGCALRGKGDLLGAGVGGIFRWNGAWTRTPSTPFVELVDLDAIGNVAWAVGGGGRIQRFDGTNWATETSPTTAALRAVWARSEATSGPSATAAWSCAGAAASGRLRRRSPPTSSSSPIAGAYAALRTSARTWSRWNGDGWAPIDAPAIDAKWISIDDRGEILAGGDGVLATWSSGRWVTDPSPPPFRAAAGAVLERGTWVVGEAGAVLERRR